MTNNVDRLDGLNSTVAIKAPCKAVSASALTLSGEQTVNGVACVTGDRVLVKDQASSVDNGIYTVSTGAWSRAPDFDGPRDVVRGTLVPVTTTGQAQLFELTASNPVTIGTTELTFAERYGANTTYDVTAAESSAGVTPTNYQYGTDPYDLRRYGFDADGTDQTSALVTFFGTTLPSTFEGVFLAPQGMAFKPESVVPQIPVGSILKCEGAIVSYDTSGESNKFYGVMAQDAAENDTHFGTVSDHHPVLMTNNLGGAGTEIAGKHGQSWVQCAGYLDQGSQNQQGFRPMSIWQWAKKTGDTIWQFGLRRIAPYAAVEYERWAQGRTYSAGDYVINDNKIYSTAAGGTAGATAPTHTTGDVSDGAVTWTYNSISDATLFNVDELGRTTMNGGVSATHLFSAIQSELDSSTNAIVSFGAQDGASSRTVALRLVPTNSGGTLTAVPQLKAYDNLGLLIRNSGDSDTIATITNSGFGYSKPVTYLSYSAADLQDAAAAPNTTNKVAGGVVRDSTNNRLLMASGSGTTATWDNIADGTTVYTPS